MEIKSDSKEKTVNLLANVFNAEKPKMIVLNGTSSSGKSTLSLALKNYLESKSGKIFSVVSIDDYLSISVNETIYEDDVFEASSAMCKNLRDSANLQINIIVDHVITSKRIFLQLIYSVKKYDIYLIHVTSPIHELRRRELLRGDRPVGAAESSLKYLFPSETYDLTIDTFQFSAKECLQQIETALMDRPKVVQEVLALTER